jgi:hypothetical protein
MSIPRKHHYLPQFYLEEFSIRNKIFALPHIWQIERRSGGKHYCVATKDAACRRDFHTIDSTDAARDHASIENVLSKIETEQAAILRDVKRTRSVSPSQKLDVAAIVSLMRYRVPAFANHVERSLQSVVLDAFKTMYSSGRFPEPPEALKALFDSEGIDSTIRVDISNWKVLSHMFAVGLDTNSIQLLSQLDYAVLTAEKGSYFLTSDNPVALYHPHYDQIRPYGVGPATKGIEITFPMTPELMLLGGHNLETNSPVAPADTVREFNRRTVIMGEQYIFTSAIDDDLVGHVVAQDHLAAGFVFDSLFYGTGAAHIGRFIPVQ